MERQRPGAVAAKVAYSQNTPSPLVVESSGWISLPIVPGANVGSRHPSPGPEGDDAGLTPRDGRAASRTGTGRRRTAGARSGQRVTIAPINRIIPPNQIYGTIGLMIATRLIVPS